MNCRRQALDLHRTCPVAVAHVDLPAELQLRRRFGQSGILMQSYLPRCRAAGIRVLIGAIFVHPMFLPEQALSSAMEQVAALLAEIRSASGAFRLVTNAAQLEQALEDGAIAILLSMEGAEPLAASPSLLLPFYALGVRLLGLTWNGRNPAADGCGLPGRGLTPMGRELAGQAWELGMILDVSHLNDAGFWELTAPGGGPVLASHSNCRSLCGHPRNLTDRQLETLGALGAVVGVNQVRFLARQPGSPGTLEDLCAHLLHIRETAGSAAAALGLDLARDYNAALPRPRDYWQNHTVEEDILTDYEQLTGLTALLLDHGLTAGEAAGILGGNLLQFLRRGLPPANRDFPSGGILL